MFENKRVLKTIVITPDEGPPITRQIIKVEYIFTPWRYMVKQDGRYIIPPKKPIGCRKGEFKSFKAALEFAQKV